MNDKILRRRGIFFYNNVSVQSWYLSQQNRGVKENNILREYTTGELT
jgi:hypothetical protein